MKPFPLAAHLTLILFLTAAGADALPFREPLYVSERRPARGGHGARTPACPALVRSLSNEKQVTRTVGLAEGMPGLEAWPALLLDWLRNMKVLS